MSDTATPAAGTGTEGAPAGAPATPAAPVTPAVPATPATPAAPAVPATPTAPQGEDTAAQIARLTSELAAARAEAGKTRVTAKQTAADEARADLAKQVMSLLDPNAAQEEATPEQLVERLTEQQARARNAEMRLAVFGAAAAAGADPQALNDSVTFRDSLANIDPTDTAAVTAAITAAVAANPRLAAQLPTGPARGGVEFGGTPGGEVTREQFAAMDYRARTALYQSDPDTYRRLAG
jgi:hypothetical protein